MKYLILLMVTLALTQNCQAQLPANLTRQLLFTASEPVAVRHAGDGSGRLFIAEQGGTIKIYDGINLLTTNFLDISSQVLNSGERGLLGLAFDPGYSANGHFYVYYSKTKASTDPNVDHDTIIERYTVSNNANIADSTSGTIIMRIEQPASNHNGGDIHFGPDGYLYIGLGDGGGSGDNSGAGNNAQNTGNLLGAMLRIDVIPENIFNNSFESTAIMKSLAGTNSCGLDSSPGSYQVPPDNPFINDPTACAEIWSYGLRNPYRWSFDKQTGDMVIGDVGQNTYEEVDFQAASSSGGENYGWRCREGAHDFNTSLCTGSETFTEPVIDINRTSNGDCSVMGGYVYRGPAIPAIQGLYIFSDYCGGNINFATPTGNTWSFQTLQNVGFGTRGFGEDEQGEIYHIFNNDIYKFILN